MVIQAHLVSCMLVFFSRAVLCADSTGTNAPYVAGSSVAAQAFFREGLGLVAKEDYTGAIKLFRSALKQEPRMAEACLNLGACYERLGQFGKGVPFYEQALSLEPKNAQFHYLFGTALARNGQLKRGVVLLERAAYLVPGNPDYLYNLGVGYAAATQFAMAATCFEEVTGIVSNSSVAWFNLGLARLKLNQTGDAARAWRQVDLDGPMAAEAQYHLAAIAAAADDTNTALECVGMALALKPDMAEAYRLMGTLQLRLGSFARAIAALEQLYLLNPTDTAACDVAAAYCSWAAAAEERDEHRLALDRYRQAVRFTPVDPAVQLGVARNALAAGDQEVARAAVDRARKHARTRAQEEEVQALSVRLGQAGAGAEPVPASNAVVRGTGP